MNIKELLFKIRIFMWYIITEPFRELVGIGRSIKKIISLLNKTLTWVYVSFVLMIIGVIKGKTLISGLLALIMFISLLGFEFERGLWMNRYRKRLRNNIKKELERSKEREHINDIKKGLIK